MMVFKEKIHRAAKYSFKLDYSGICTLDTNWEAEM
jgi:aspartate 1-decarboxylase